MQANQAPLQSALLTTITTCVFIGLSGLVKYTDASTTPTTTVRPAAPQMSKEEDKSFPPWLVGVIVLSGVAVIILMATVVQRIMRSRAANNEQYRMNS